MTEVAGKMRAETLFQLKTMLASEIRWMEGAEQLLSRLPEGEMRRAMKEWEDSHRVVANTLAEEIKQRHAVLATGPLDDVLKLPKAPKKPVQSLEDLKEWDQAGISQCHEALEQQVLDESAESLVQSLIRKKQTALEQLRQSFR